MATQPTAECQTEKLDFRVSPSAKATLQAAARVVKCNVSDFIRDSAMARAEETLADRVVFRLDPAKWEAFQMALDAPPQPMPRMKALLDEPGFFEQTSGK